MFWKCYTGKNIVPINIVRVRAVPNQAKRSGWHINEVPFPVCKQVWHLFRKAGLCPFLCIGHQRSKGANHFSCGMNCKIITFCFYATGYWLKLYTSCSPRCLCFRGLQRFRILSQATRTYPYWMNDFSQNLNLSNMAAVGSFLAAMLSRNLFPTDPEGFLAPLVATKGVSCCFFGSSAYSVCLSPSNIMNKSFWIVLISGSTIRKRNQLNRLPVLSCSWCSDSGGAKAYFMLSNAVSAPYSTSSSDAFFILLKIFCAVQFSNTIPFIFTQKFCQTDWGELITTLVLRGIFVGQTLQNE